MIIRTLLIATGAMLLSACQPESSDDAATIAAAKAGYDAFATGDMDAWAKTQAADAKWTMPKGFPYAGVYYGPEQVIEEVFAPIGALWPDFKVEPVAFHASGNVVFVETNGTTHKSDVMTLDSEFTHIIAETLRTRNPDGSFFTAKDGDIKTESLSIFDSSRFSACNCDFENGETPIWDLRATSTRHNVETKTIVHRNVRMHIMNVPIGYLPYLAHPDWTVRRQSGFLTPTFLLNTDLGFTSSIPYFMVIDDTRDVEFTPFIYQRRGNALRTRYRQYWDRSELGVSLYTASVETYKKNAKICQTGI